jgi:hypothetical protein
MSISRNGLRLLIGTIIAVQAVGMAASALAGMTCTQTGNVVTCTDPVLKVTLTATNVNGQILTTFSGTGPKGSFSISGNSKTNLMLTDTATNQIYKIEDKKGVLDIKPISP